MTIVYEFLTVIVVLSSFLGLGKSLSKILKLQESTIPLDGLLGAGVYAFSVSILGHFISLFEVTTVLIMSGLIFFIFCLHKRWFNFQLSLPWFVVLYLIFAFVIAFYPSTYFDPLNYHLYGIVEWSKLDRLSHIKSAIQIMHNSYADYLYFPFSFWWGQTKIDDLISVQVSSQVFTVLLGITCFSFLFYELLRDKFEKIWIPLFIMAALTRASLQHKGFIAKNDWIALSWFLGSAYIILKCQGNRLIIIILSSFLMGLSIGTKFSYIIPSLVFMVLLIHSGKLKFKNEVIYSFFLVLIFTLPYFLRNYFWTKNPIFPMGEKLFKSEFLGPSWIEGFALFDVGVNNSNYNFILKKLIRIFTYDAYVYFGLFLPFFFRVIKSTTKILWIKVYFFAVTFIFFLGPFSELRHFGFIAIMLNIFGVYVIFLFTRKFKIKNQKLMINIILLSIVINFLLLENQLNPIPSALRKGVIFPRVQSLFDEGKGMELSRALGNNLKKNQKIAIIDDTPPFYLSMHNVIRLWDDPVLDKELKNCSNLVCVVQILQKEQIDFLAESSFIFDPHFNYVILTKILEFSRKHPDIVYFSKNSESLISVESLACILNNTLENQDRFPCKPNNLKFK